MLRIEYLKEEIPVYDITVEDNHNFFANDILVSNCTEIMLPSRASENISEELITSESGDKKIIKTYSAGEIALCNLSSFNLEKWYYLNEEERWSLVRNVVRALDNTVDLATYPVKEGKNSNMMYRYLGLGVLNYANYLALNEMVIDSQEALEETDRLFDDLSFKIITVSMELAQEKGHFEKFYETEWSEGILPIHKANKYVHSLTKYEPDMDKWNELAQKVKLFGIRNAQLMAIAPTACSTRQGTITLADGEVVSLEQLMSADGIDFGKLESEGIQKWNTFKDPITISSRSGDKKVSRIWYNGKQPTKTITFSDGEEYTFTLNHRLLVEQEWVYVQDLTEDMLVSMQLGSMGIDSIVDGGMQHTYDIEVPEVHEYILGNGCISHNTSGKAINATESTEPIHSLFYKEEGTLSIPTLVPNFRKNNKYYKPAFDCDQYALIRNMCVRQKYVDQGMSTNMYIARPDSLKDLTNLHLYAFYYGAKSLYYMKQKKGDSTEECSSCT